MLRTPDHQDSHVSVGTVLISILRATGNRHLADAHVADRWCQKPPAYALIL